MPRPEKLIMRTAGSLFLLAAVLEAVARLGHRPGFHDSARWAVAAAFYVVLIPLFVVLVVLAYQAVFARKKGRDGS